MKPASTIAFSTATACCLLVNFMLPVRKFNISEPLFCGLNDLTMSSYSDFNEFDCNKIFFRSAFDKMFGFETSRSSWYPTETFRNGLFSFFVGLGTGFATSVNLLDKATSSAWRSDLRSALMSSDFKYDNTTFEQKLHTRSSPEHLIILPGTI